MDKYLTIEYSAKVAEDVWNVRTCDQCGAVVDMNWDLFERHKRVSETRLSHYCELRHGAINKCICDRCTKEYMDRLNSWGHAEGDYVFTFKYGHIFTDEVIDEGDSDKHDWRLNLDGIEDREKREAIVQGTAKTEKYSIESMYRRQEN